MNDQGNSPGSPIPPNGWGNQGATPQQSDTATKKAPSLLKTFLVAFGGAAVACALVLGVYSFIHPTSSTVLGGKRGRHNACRSGFPEMPSFGS